MLVALGSLAAQKASPTEIRLAQINQFLYYALSHCDAIMTNSASDGIISLQWFCLYIQNQNMKLQRKHFFLSKNKHYHANNGAVPTIAQIMKTGMFSAAEAELGMLCINSHEAIPQ